MNYATERLQTAAATLLKAFGGDTPEWLSAEAEELQDALHYFAAHGDPDAVPSKCRGCGRDEAICSADPCAAVIEDRAA